jgi:excisionase family DNA binding protein
MTAESLITARELADFLGLSPATVLDRFERGELPGFKLGDGAGAPVRFRRAEVEAWLEGCRRGPVYAPATTSVNGSSQTSDAQVGSSSSTARSSRSASSSVVNVEIGPCSK